MRAKIFALDGEGQQQEKKEEDNQYDQPLY
jgi:hypothetical protein